MWNIFVLLADRELMIRNSLLSARDAKARIIITLYITKYTHKYLIYIYTCRCICFMGLKLLKLTVTRDELRTFYSAYLVIYNIFQSRISKTKLNTISLLDSLREVENPFRNTPFTRLSHTKWLSSFPSCNWTSLFGWYSQWSVTWIEATVYYGWTLLQLKIFGRFTDLGPHQGWRWQRQNCNSLNKNNNNKMNCCGKAEERENTKIQTNK